MKIDQLLEQKALQVSVVTIRGVRFGVREMNNAENSRLFAEHRDAKGKLKKTLDHALLCQCVVDPDTEEPFCDYADREKWDQLGNSFVRPLMAEIMRLNGLDDEDVGREVKNSDSTGGCD